MVSCWVRLTPSAAGSTRNRSTSVSASPVRARTTRRLADDAKATCRLVPDRVQPVTVGLGPQLHAPRTRTVLGLQPRRGEDGLAGDDARQPRLLLLGVAGAGQCPAGEDRADEVGRGRDGPTELLVEHHGLERRHARAAVLLGELQPDQVEMGELLPQFGRVPRGIVLELADHAERAGGGEEAPHRLTEHLLLGAEGQVQHVVLSSGGAAGCGVVGRAVSSGCGVVGRVVEWSCAGAVRRTGRSPVRASSGSRSDSTGCRRGPSAGPPGPCTWSWDRRRRTRRCRAPPSRTRCRPPRCR